MWQAQDASYSKTQSIPAPEEWASKHGDKNYALEVAQNPIRARMCGFGDKDRRPLAPAAIAKLVVTDKDNRVIPPDSLQVAFFIVLVDLWDEHGLKESNLVRVPVPSGITSRRYRVQRGDSQTSTPRYGPTNAAEAVDQTANADPSSPTAIGVSSISSPTRASANGSPTSKRRRIRRNTSSIDETFAVPLEEIPTQPFYATQDPAPISFYSTYTHPEFMGFQSYINQYQPALPDPIYPTMSADPANATALTQVMEQPFAATNGSSHSWPVDEPLEYARTLIGPLAASAQTLKDDKDQLGIFFLFQDLSVRTEGIFRLRMRLVNVGAYPAPDPGATTVRCEDSTVLAQVFTEPFEVFSAKKFPGVPPATLLSQKLLQQGLKIPGRTKSPTKGGSDSRSKKRKKPSGDWAPGSGTHSDTPEE